MRATTSAVLLTAFSLFLGSCTLSDKLTPSTEVLRWYRDLDGDGFGDPANRCLERDKRGCVSIGRDCADQDPDIHPGVPEIPGDGIDQDCDRRELCFEDRDLDGFGALALSSRTMDCQRRNLSARSGDCDDMERSVFPGAPERCDGRDDDCDGIVDEGARQLPGPIGLICVGTVAEGGSPVGEAGYSVDFAGDTDGDGIPDLIVGEPAAMRAGIRVGGAWLVSGADWGKGDLADIGVPLWGASALDRTGAAVRGAGDLNGDGIADIAVGAWNANDAGTVYLLSGPVLKSTELADTWDIRLVGEDPDDRAGWSLDATGDLDADGQLELAVGAPRADETFQNTGKVYLVDGSVPSTTLLGDLPDYLYGPQDGNAAGTSVAGLGDIDGDGVDDLLIGGAAARAEGKERCGLAWLVQGPISGAFSLASADATFIGEEQGHRAGYSVAAAGDVNGDSFGDLLIGALGADFTGTNAGAAYLVLGPISGTWSLSDVDARLLGPERKAHAGHALTGAGDIDDDGFDDIAVGALNHGVLHHGGVWMIHGPVSGTVDLSGSDLLLEGSGDYEHAGASLAGASDWDLDGRDDLLVGAPGYFEGVYRFGGVYLLSGSAL